ncbi:MAG: type II secretion system F family protein [Nitrospirae bacterium]|nr:type II secretion system F family protein [Nitrospirota bacterium]
MPQFLYNGYRSDGSPASGTVEADGLQDAVANIKALGVFPKHVSEYSYEEKRWSFRKKDRPLLPHITRQLSTLLSSGVPLMEALRSLSEENRGFWRAILIKIRERVAGGSGLSRALEEHEKVFPEFYIHMVAAGEQSGRLDKILERVADFLERQTAIQSKVRSAMVYPIFMSSVGIVVLSFLFTFVVPKIVRIFENTKSALPFITVILIYISNFFVYYWWLLIIIAASAVFGARRLREKNRPLIDRVKLNMPGGLLQSLYFSRFSRTLGFLLEGGLPMLRSLELSGRSCGNVILEEKILEAAKSVAEGARLSSSLIGFPPVLLQLIATGEKSGTLAEVLNRAASSYEEEFGRKVEKALSLLEPLMILLMGLIVGFIVLAVLLPMFQLNQLVK